MYTNIGINVITLLHDEYVIFDNIKFEDCSYIQILLDGEDIRNFIDFEDMLVVYSELKKSGELDGHYLIFTCACGVADDGGWELVKVKYDNNSIIWSFNHELSYSFRFQKDSYLSEMKKLDLIIQSNSPLALIPEFFIYPE